MLGFMYFNTSIVILRDKDSFFVRTQEQITLKTYKKVCEELIIF